MTSALYPNLIQLFGGYLNQDWPYEFGQPHLAIQAFIDGSGIDTRKRTLDELTKFLAQIREIPNRDAENLLFDAVGCYYLPSVDGKSTIQWIFEVIYQIKCSMKE